MRETLRVQKVSKYSKLPVRATRGSAGLDLTADEEVVIPPGETRLVPTGIRIQLPEGFEGQIRPRSGLALHHRVTVLNSPGTIDSDYRGEVRVLLINHGDAPFVLARGHRIAQLVIAPVVEVEVLEVASLEETERGQGGFGSTGSGSDVQ